MGYCLYDAYNLWPESTAGPIESACPHCSSGISQVFHAGGPCPRVKAKEYHRNGTLKRIEYVQHKWPVADVDSDNDAPIWTAPDFDEPMELVPSSLLDALRRVGEFELEEDTLLPAGRYRIIDHEPRRILDEAPPDMNPLPEDADILKVRENGD